MILAGDIGGTKTRLAVFPAGGSLGAPLQEAVFASTGYSSLEDMVREFIARTGCPVEKACFGVAGPVTGGRATLTNLPWRLDVCHLREILGFRSVSLINDVLATAAAIPHLGGKAILTVQEGQADPEGNRAVIAAGTGLGEAFMVRNGGQWQACATEGGHTDYAPRSAEERDLWQFATAMQDHVSYETVCSGPGIALIYRHLRERFPDEEPPGLREALAGAADPTPLIVDEAMRAAGACPLCIETIRFFTSILGAEAGNLALKVLATGGLYIGGGIPPRMLPYLKEEGFLRSFADKGRMSTLMKRIPVHLILEPRAALLGAAHWLLERERD